ncbi:MAG: hypothetical protein LBI77_00395 [Puniceicoccales bacterium]|jgi:UDP-N-acetylmuramoyl-tripeptide--D-alanyl-D-alanine ligase|nr:hypothetical protein [Puniceicoccales bacterium]
MKITLFHRLPEVIFWGNFPEEINGFWNDTRTIQAGDCFLALADRRDGHEFLSDAQQKGAHCALVRRIDKNLSLPQLGVPDVFEAAKKIAKLHRKNYTTIAITGSYGKTSTKDMLKLLLGEKAYATADNLNNELGVTLSLSRINGEQFAIIEGGINHPGEMDRIDHLIEPNISLTTGITFTHVSNFQNFEQLVNEKCKILQNTLARNGMGIIPESCLKYMPFQELAPRCTVIGRGKNLKRFKSFTRFHLEGEHRIVLEGRYFKKASFGLPEMSLGQVENFANGATVAKILGFSDGIIRERILQWKPGKMRGEIFDFNGHAVYLDSYNANPVAMKNALIHFDKKYTGNNTYVLGGMRELGEFSENCHRRLAEYFLEKERGLIIAVGAEMKVFCKILRAKNRKLNVSLFEDVQTAREFFHKRYRGKIFIKGSQFYRLWEILEELEE